MSNADLGHARAESPEVVVSPPRFRAWRTAFAGFPLASLLGCLTLLTAVAWAQSQAHYRIDTVAGGIGDGGLATASRLKDPLDVTVDGSGNLYIADTSNHRVRKVDTTGKITTVAGTGRSGFSGDGGPATAARLDAPSGVAVDESGNLYIADRLNNRIRKVDTSGRITTVAGTGTSGFSDDGGPATAARIFSPSGVALDGSGNLYIADQLNNRIRKVDTSGKITTVAGTGTGSFGGDGGPATQAWINSPRSVEVDGSGNLYIVDRWNYRIRKVDTAGTITTVAGTGTSGFSGDGGQATDARINAPRGVAVDGSGNLYIADTSNNRIRKVDSSGVITTVAGTGTLGFSGDGGQATAAKIWEPSGVEVDGSGNLYIADTQNYRIRKVDTSGTITTVVGVGLSGFGGDGGPATGAQIRSPQGVEVDGSGNLYIADPGNHRVRKVDTSGTITTVAGTGTRGFSGDNGPATEAQLDWPQRVAVDGSGNLYITDRNRHRVRKVDTAGTITTVAGTGTAGFSGDDGPATSAQINRPEGVAVDESGNLYISDTSNQRIRKVDSSGVITTVAGNGTLGFSGDDGPATDAQLSNPRGIEVGRVGQPLHRR